MDVGTYKHTFARSSRVLRAEKTVCFRLFLFFFFLFSVPAQGDMTSLDPPGHSTDLHIYTQTRPIVIPGTRIRQPCVCVGVYVYVTLDLHLAWRRLLICARALFHTLSRVDLNFTAQLAAPPSLPSFFFSQDLVCWACPAGWVNRFTARAQAPDMI
jgi:hypothetical protein